MVKSREVPSTKQAKALALTADSGQTRPAHGQAHGVLSIGYQCAARHEPILGDIHNSGQRQST